MTTASFTYVLDPSEPIARVGAGEQISLSLEDSASGQIQSREDLPTPDRLPDFFSSPPRVNPVVGPVWIEGVKSGDEVAVTVHRLELAERGFTCRFFVPGVLRTDEWKGLEAPETYLLRKDAESSSVRVEGSHSNVSFPLAPFIGTLALVPSSHSDPSSATSRGSWGGNIDVRDVSAGSTIYLESHWDGGLLYAGDLHGVQGDMEWSASAGEFAGTVTLSAAGFGRTGLPLPRIETPERLICLGMDSSLERAVDIATSGLMRWLVGAFGTSEADAFLHVSVNPRFRINFYSNGEFARLAHIVGAELPKTAVSASEEE